MKYYNIKSIILGVGIGFIITAMAGSVYFSFIARKSPMTKEEIITEAKKYGMIEPASVLKSSDDKSSTVAPSQTPAQTNAPTPSITPSITPAIAPSIVPTPSAQPTPTLGPEVDIKVDSGDTAVIVAKKLFDNKLIDNQDSFVKQMIESGAAYKMFAKDYHLRLGMTEEDIIKTLTTR